MVAESQLGDECIKDVYKPTTPVVSVQGLWGKPDVNGLKGEARFDRRAGI